MECWGGSSPLAVAKDPLGHVTWNAASPGCRCSCCLELLGCSRCRTRTAVTPQGTAPCSTASPAPPPWVVTTCREQLLGSPSCQCALGCFQNPLGTMELSPQPPSHCPGTAGVEPGAARHGPSSSPVPGSPGEQLADSSPTNKVTGPPPGALHPLHWLVGRTWRNHGDAECWAWQGPCGLKLTWPIKVLLCRSALAACLDLLGWKQAGGVGLSVLFVVVTQQQCRCARAPWHCLLSHRAAWGRAQFSPCCWSKGHCHPTCFSPSW